MSARLDVATVIAPSREGTTALAETRIGRLAAWLAVVVGAAITSLNLMHVNAYMWVLGPGMALAGVITLTVRRNPSAAPAFPALPRRLDCILIAIFCLLFGVVTLMAHHFVNERSLIFFVLVAVAVGVLALTAGMTQSPVGVACFLLAAVLLSLVVRGSVFFLTPGFPGSDAWGHEQLTQALLTGGHIPSMSVWDSPYYLYYPVLHLSTAMTASVLGVSSKVALFVCVGLPLAFSATAVCAVSRRVVGRHMACIAALIVLFTSYHLQWGTQIIPTSMGLALFSSILLVVIDGGQRVAQNAALSVLFVITIVLCHTVSSFILWVALIALLAATIFTRVFKDRSPACQKLVASYLPLVLLTLVMFTHWGANPYTTTGNSFFEQILITLRESLVGDARFLNRPMEGGELLGQELLSVSGFGLFYFFVVMGALRWFRDRTSAATKYSFIAGVAFLSAIAFVFPLFGIRNVIPHRWFAFAWVLAAPLAVEGLRACALSLRLNAAATTAVFIVTLSALAFLMIVDPMSNTDSPQGIGQITQRMVFYESEIRAAEWVVDAADGPLAADLQFGSRVMQDHAHAKDVFKDPRDIKGLQTRFYVWRATSLGQPVQVGDGTSLILGPLHAAKVETQRPSIYSSAQCRIFAPLVLPR